MEFTLIITGSILAICFLALSWFAGTDAPYVATKSIRIDKMLHSLGNLKGKRFFELGSGDGRVVLAAASLGASAFGIEQSLIRVLYSKWAAKKINSGHKAGSATFIHDNIFSFLPKLVSPDKSIGQIIIYIFLLPPAVLKLEKLLKNLPKGTLIITQTFHFKNWQPIKKILVSDQNKPNQDLGKNQLEGDFWIYQV